MNPVFYREGRTFLGGFFGWCRDNSGCFCVRFQFRSTKYKMNFWIRETGRGFSGIEELRPVLGLPHYEQNFLRVVLTVNPVFPERPRFQFRQALCE